VHVEEIGLDRGLFVLSVGMEKECEREWMRKGEGNAPTKKDRTIRGIGELWHRGVPKLEKPHDDAPAQLGFDAPQLP